jgi:hypothetical protein
MTLCPKHVVDYLMIATSDWCSSTKDYTVCVCVCVCVSSGKITNNGCLISHAALRQLSHLCV